MKKNFILYSLLNELKPKTRNLKTNLEIICEELDINSNTHKNLERLKKRLADLIDVKLIEMNLEIDKIKKNTIFEVVIIVETDINIHTFGEGFGKGRIIKSVLLENN